jgi:hypothetical protein
MENLFTRLSVVLGALGVLTAMSSYDVRRKTRWTSQKQTAAMTPAAGIVSTQAHTILPATPHLTAESRRVAPTPTIAPVMV